VIELAAAVMAALRAAAIQAVPPLIAVLAILTIR
jgi:hypothetical protein